MPSTAQLVQLARVEALGFLILLAVVIFLKLLVGAIPLDDLLTGDRRDGSSYFSLGRAQLLVCTAIIAVEYVRQVAAHTSLTSLPDLPTGALELLGGSQLAYLVGKARAFRYGSSTPFLLKGKG